MTASALLYRLSSLRHAIDEAAVTGTLSDSERCQVERQAELLADTARRLQEKPAVPRPKLVASV